jgi:predicted outer membrane repeat protein
VQVKEIPPPTEITVTNLNDSGEGSLRQALEEIASGGTISFDPALAGGTLALAGPLVPSRSVTIDGSAVPALNLDGGGFDRVLVVDPGLDVTVIELTLTDGYGFQLAGCVLNNGTLTLDRATVTGCTMTTDAGDFWQGGGGIYNGDGATLNLVDSVVSDNTSGHAGGGVYSFFNTTTTVVGSTISGNVAAGDVGGGFRTLGNASITDSVVSGNTSTAWHGGGIFATDGTVTILRSEFVDNIGPEGTAGGIMVATFGAPVSMTLQDSVVANNVSYGCQVEGGAAAVLTSLGGNTFTDGSCNPGADDVIVSSFP